MARPSFAPFRHRAFTLFWIGSFVSNIGTIMESVALGIYVQDRTGRATWNGIVAALGFLPTGLCAPLGGALADRMSRKRLLGASTIAMMILATLMTIIVATNRGAPIVIALIAFAGGAANAIGWPAFQSLLPDLVPPELLVSAVGLSSAQWNLARVVAPACAALVVSFAGVPWALGFNAVSFVAVLVVVVVVPIPSIARAPSTQRVAVAIRQGWAYVRHDSVLWLNLRTLCFNAFFGAAYLGLVPAVARKVFHGGKDLTGVLSTAMGVGAVVAAITLGQLVGRFGVRRVITGITIAMPLATAAYALAPGPALAVPAIAALGFCYITGMLSYTTVVQTRTPPELRGRVLSINTVGLGLSYPLAVLVQGTLGDHIGLRGAMLTFAGVALASIAFIRLRRPAIAEPFALSA